MKIKIEINTDNDAFQPDPVEEIKAILNKYIALITTRGLNRITMLDINGNTCGTITITK